jgi:hypothetical protein
LIETPKGKMKSFGEFVKGGNCHNEVAISDHEINRRQETLESLAAWRREIQNEVITVRCPNVFKEQLTEWASQHGMGLSEAVRVACMALMKR